jgi:hypothetical protein
VARFGGWFFLLQADVVNVGIAFLHANKLWTNMAMRLSHKLQDGVLFSFLVVASVSCRAIFVLMMPCLLVCCLPYVDDGGTAECGPCSRGHAWQQVLFDVMWMLCLFLLSTVLLSIGQHAYTVQCGPIVNWDNAHSCEWHSRRPRSILLVLTAFAVVLV